MKRMYRKISWLLLLAMLISAFTVGVVAEEGTEGTEGTKVMIQWEGAAPENLEQAKLDLYIGEDKVTKTADGQDAPIMLVKAEEWITHVSGLAVKDATGAAITYTAKFVPDNDGILAEYDAVVTISEEGAVVVKATPKTTVSVPEASPEASPEVSPETSPEAAPEVSAEPTPETSPEVSPETSPEVSTEPAPEASPEVSPETSPEVSTEPAPEASPEVSPETSPEVSPEVSPDPVVPETVDVAVSVVWSDGEDQDGIRPQELKVQLYNGETASGDPVTMKAGSDGKWAYAFTGLDKDSVWSVKVVTAPEGYAVSYAADANGNITITNTHTPATVSYTVTVNWDDNNDQLDQRPDSVKVQLYKVVKSTENGKTVNKRVDIGSPVSIKKNDAGKWVYTYSGLAKFASGTAITYKYALVETPAGYSATYNFNTGIVKLTNGYRNATTIDLKVVAKWVDNNDKYDKRPSSITVTLYADDVKSKAITIKPDSSGNWTYTFNDLVQYKNGEKVDYEVKMTAVNKYVSKVKYTTSGTTTTATITNTYSDIPLTGDSSNMMLWLALAAAGSAVLLGVAGVEVRKNRMMK